MTKKNDSITPETTLEKDCRIFVDAVKNIDRPSALSMTLYRHFAEEMRKAVDNGCICTPERMASLYPIFREINIEQEETARIFENNERKYKERDAKKLARKTEVKK